MSAAPWEASDEAVDAYHDAIEEAQRAALDAPALPYPALHACLYCGRHPATHAPADSSACPGCGLGDALEP